MSGFSRSMATGLLLSTLALAACSSDDDPAAPVILPPLGVTTAPTSVSSIRVTFNSVAGDNSYEIERAEGAAGSFAPATTVAAPATAGTVTYDDTNLKVSTLYRYRITAVRGTSRSQPSSEASATTFAFGGNQTIDVTTDITTNTTWKAENTYVLKGFIHVANGATLTIEPGTTVKGDFNTLGASLFILRGAKINAVGRADAPIVFTSSRAAGQRQPGDWGGLVIVGNATINRSGVEIEIEGTNTASGTTSGTNYKVVYSGGTTDTDNSGEMRYVRVEFAGFAPSINNELNSFTFAAVGSGTKLSFLQSLAGLDDAFEFFGGTVDATNLVSYESGDDHFDMSEGYRGRLQHIIALQTTQLAPRTSAGSASTDPQGIENDGCNGAGCTNGFNTAPFTIPVVANFTLVGTGDIASSASAGGVGMMLRRGTGGYYVNGVVSRWARAAFSVRDGDTYVRAGSTAIPNLATADFALRNILLTENAAAFQTGGSATQNTFDVTGNALEAATGATSALFTALPASGATPTTATLDWTPPSASPAATGGLTTLAGKLATAAGTVVTGTAYRGAANPAGTKWWQGWTTYARN
ncbi:MAG: fibronectin type III domain-containing protein [Gemmatimonadetes bacterium]|nr:fibronectin type III domain-containing protein [Gemmatimonadota bacterium]MBK8061431.1 fibronectin type III domain-containing protein [Gemmatimonadota bacterium]